MRGVWCLYVQGLSERDDVMWLFKAFDDLVLARVKRATRVRGRITLSLSLYHTNKVNFVLDRPECAVVRRLSLVSTRSR